MEKLSQIFLPFVSNLITSSVVWIIYTMYLLSSRTINNFFGIRNSYGFVDLTPNLPLSKSFACGLLVGLVHGVVTGLITYWYKSYSIGGRIISSIAATELLLLITFVAGFATIYINQPFKLDASEIVTAFVEWFGLFSVLFLISSIIIGIVNKFILNLFTLL